MAPILIYFFVYESPRFLIMKRDFSRGFKELDRMGFKNHGNNYIPLDLFERDILMENSIKKNSKIYDSNKFFHLFSRKLFFTSIGLSILWFLTCYVDFGS